MIITNNLRKLGQLANLHPAMYLWLVVAYLVSGKLGLMLAMPPGYASPIFPPAGIAVAAALIGGRKTLPWIFFGALLLNLWTGFSSGMQINMQGLAAAAIIAFASALQAAIGSRLMRRMIGYPVSLDKGSELLQFLLFAPLFCSTSATISVSGLVVLGIVEPASFASNWGAWWIGDTLGVLVMFPLVMIVAGEPRALWRGRRLTVGAPMLVFSALLIAIFLKANQWENNDSLSNFRQLSQQAVNQVHTKLEEQEFLLEQMAGFFMHDPGRIVSRDEFHRFVQTSLARFPMVQAIEWAARIDQTQRVDFEARQRADLPGFEIRERNSAGQLLRASERSSYYPVTYVEPLVGNEPAAGFDLASNAERLAAINKSRQSGATVITAAIKLVQEQQQQAGVLLLLAVNTGNDHSGAVLTVLRMGDFMERLLQDTRPMFYTRLIDLDDRKILYNNFAPDSLPALYEHVFSFGTRHYSLETAPTPLYYKQHRGWQSWGVLTVGALGAALLGALLLLGTGYTARVEAQVEDRTRKLKESKNQLRENAMLSKTILDSIGEGLHGINRDGKIIFENQAVINMLGWDMQGMIGQSAHLLIHHTRADGSSYPQSECPIYATLDDGVTRHVADEVFWRKDGSSLPVDYICTAMRNAAGENIGAVVSFRDITERKRAEENLRMIASVFDSAQEGILISDANNSIVDVNPAFTRITGYSRDEVVGRNPLLLNSGRHGKAFYAAMWQSLKQDKVWRGEIWNRRKSGEIYPELLSISALCDGDGRVLRYVGVFSDISYIKAHEAELSRIAHYDALTGIPNRVLLFDRMKQAIAQTLREKKVMAVCYLDLDGFKLINDSMGHETGDQVLHETARRIENTIRGGDTVARLGGDEFVVLLLGLERIDECVNTLERILAAIAQPITVDSGSCTIGASIGVSIFPQDDEDPDTLMRHADQAMYIAKQSGKNRFQIYSSVLG